MTSIATLPAIGGSTAWQLDPTHTEVEFSARHLMISNVKGRFGNPAGRLSYDPTRPGSLDFEVTIPVAGVDTRNEQRDAHLRSPDFFDAANHPTMTFRGKRVEGDIGGEFRLSGDLTIRGVTRPVTLDVTTEGGGDDPWGNERLGFSATGRINRSEFGLKWNQLLETGGVAVSDEIRIIINAELFRPRSS
ncbi:MAG: YceI family protein [Gemmatimonadales bacterium]